jgi:CRISPR-associated protein Cas2
MAINRGHLCLICYDIADPKRLAQVHRFLREEGLPVQYSVFTLRLTVKKQTCLCEGLKERIDERKDDMRIYPLAEHAERIYVGRQLFLEDVMLLGNGGNLLV